MDWEGIELFFERKVYEGYPQRIDYGQMANIIGKNIIFIPH